MDVTTKAKFAKIRQQQRIKAVQMGITFDETSQKGSVWSEAPPSPRALNEKLIWKSNLHEQNRVTRCNNQAVGFLGEYIALDTDNSYRLTNKLKTISRNTTNPMKTAPSGGFDVTGFKKRPIPGKPHHLEPL